MKKLVSISMLLVIAALILLLNACKHEFSGDRCQSEPIRITLLKTDATGNQNNGSIRASATGGENFQYSLNGAAFRDSGNFSGLQPYMNYNIVVKNSWGCTDTGEVSIGVFDPCAGTTVAVTTTKVDATINQNNGSITATATGGAGFTFSLNGGTFQASGSFAGLAAGNYTVTAKNNEGCTGTSDVIIGSVNPCTGITITVTTTKVDPTAGQSNGSITVSATGGTGFTYSLNSGAYQSANTFTGLPAGSYTVTAKSAAGCTGSAVVILGTTNACNGVTITVTLTKTDPTSGQSNGSITATATGGTGFTYSLNGGAFQTSNTFTNLAAGTYTVTAKSSAGCLGTASITLVAASPCTGINITISNAVVTYTPCTTPATGKITVTATGSTGFTYNLNGGAYQASNIFSGLNAGNYTVGVKDANGCTKSAAATVGTTAMGPMFTSMRSLISTRCNGSGCHMGAGNNAAGYNFDTDCSIVTYWSQINRSCVTYTMTKMPKSPQSLLTAAEKLIITNWVNAGHRYTD